MNVTNDEVLYQFVGKKIKFFREQKALSQTVLASKVNLSRTSIVSIEQGKQRASLFLLWTIAESLGIAIHELLPYQADLVSNDKTASQTKSHTVDESSQAKLSEFIRGLQSHEQKKANPN